MSSPCLAAAFAALLSGTLPILGGSPLSIEATPPPDRPDHWQFVPLEACPPGLEALLPPASATARERRVFVLRAPVGLRARGFGLALAHGLPGLRIDPGDLTDLVARRMAPSVPLFMGAWCPRPGGTFSYGSFVLGVEPIKDTLGREAMDVDLGRDILALSLELDPGGATAGNRPLEGMEAGYLDGSGILHRVPVDVGRLSLR